MHLTKKVSKYEMNSESTEKINRLLQNYNEVNHSFPPIIDRVSRQKFNMPVGRPEQHNQHNCLNSYL